MAQRIDSYSIEIKNESNERLAVFTFADVTADELQTILAEFRRILGDMGAAVVDKMMSPTVVSGFALGSRERSLPAAEPRASGLRRSRP